MSRRGPASFGDLRLSSLLLALAILPLVGPLPSARAAITPTGDVSPSAPAAWGTATVVHIGGTLSGTLTIDGDSDVISGRSYLGSSSGGAGFVTVSDPGSTWTISNELSVGNGGVGVLSISNGGVVTSDSYVDSIGSSSWASGTVTVDGAGSAWNAGSILYVAANGNGTLKITGGGRVSGSIGYVAYNNGSSGAVTVNGYGSIWSQTGTLYVANSGTGTLVISNGGAVSNSVGYIGNNSGASGTVTVDGTGSTTWTNTDELCVGNFGRGTLKINNGGTVTSSYGYVGASTGSSGTATVDGAGSFWCSPGPLFVACSGSGTLNITNGGCVSNSSAYIGYYSTSSGAATIDGSGSTWINTGDLNVGASGKGTLNIFSGGSVSVAGTTSVSGSSGMINFGSSGGTLTTNMFMGSLARLNGAGIITTRGLLADIDLTFDGSGCCPKPFAMGGTLNVDMRAVSGNTDLAAGYATSSSLQVRNGAILYARDGYLGYNSGASGTATVSGSGSTWNNSNLYVARSGRGVLKISNGGTVNNSASAFIGSKSGSSGTATVDGAGSTWINGSNLYVADSGAGLLKITNGGAVSDSWGAVGNNTGASGAVTVDGGGSIWTSSSRLEIGYSGSGTLEITAGGTVTGLMRYVGHNSGSAGTVTVDGANSALDGGSLHVGYSGRGVLRVVNGGSVLGSSGVIATFEQSSGTTTVDGPRSMWTSSGDIIVGGRGAATLNITNGGTVACAGSTLANGGSSSLGTVFVDGPGSAWTNSRSLYVGESGNGVLRITDHGTATCSSARIANFGVGKVTVDGEGSAWSSSGGLSVGGLNSGQLEITNGGTVSNTSANVGESSGSFGKVTVDGAGSTWINSGELRVGSGASGTLRIVNGAVVTSPSARIGMWTGSSGTVTIDGALSKWSNSGVLYVGSSGAATLSIAGGSSVTAGSISMNNQSLLAIDVGRASSLLVAGGTGTFTNNGQLRIVAGAGVPVNNSITYSPISAKTWGGTGTCQPIGGTWDATNHLFKASGVTTRSSGSPVSLDLASIQRASVTYDRTSDPDWALGASFPVAASSTTFTATAINGGVLDALKSVVGDDQDILSGWALLTTGYTVSATDPIYLSLKVGSRQSLDMLDLWTYSGSTWSAYTPLDLTYDGMYASFTASSLGTVAVSGLPVPEPGTLGLLAVCAIGLLAYARRRHRAEALQSKTG
jgi:fibronectin-binding autotransporter adhesin